MNVGIRDKDDAERTWAASEHAGDRKETRSKPANGYEGQKGTGEILSL